MSLTVLATASLRCRSQAVLHVLPTRGGKFMAIAANRGETPGRGRL